jgi:hypothetical protein
MTPELRQFGSLTLQDFQRVPVWISCHTADYDEPWYEKTDEETFRPWTGALPVEPSGGMYLVRAEAHLADGSTHAAFLTPSADADLGLAQPQLFLGDRCFSFWGGLAGVPAEVRKAFYDALGKAPESIFPITFVADARIATGTPATLVNGFYRSTSLTDSVVER